MGLLGPNGAGKTTTFYMVVGLTPPDAGQVFLGEEDITELPMYLRAQRGISYLPQEPSVFRRMSVEDNLRSIFETLDLSHAEQERRIDQLIADFGLVKVRKSRGYPLSGGERRRVEIARALVINPWYILLDEPFAGIDPIAVLDIQGIIRHLKSMGIGVLITDHNVRETLKITDRAYIINNGEILRSGTPHELSTDPQVRKIYLGEDFTSVRLTRHGIRAKTFAEAGAEAGDDAIAAAGDQAAADDPHGARDAADAGAGREPRAGRDQRGHRATRRRRAKRTADANGEEVDHSESMENIDLDAYFGDYWEGSGYPSMMEEREEPPIENSLTREPDLYDHLLWQLHMAEVSPRLREIAELIIGNLNTDGFLVATPEEIRAMGDQAWEEEEARAYTMEEVLEALDLVRSFDPPGIACSDLRESLLLQLDTARR